MKVNLMSKLGSMSQVIALALGTFLCLSSSAQANGGLVFGNLQPATTVGTGLYSFGAAATAGDNFTTVQGDIAYGFGMFTEGRLRLGVSDIDAPNSDPTVAFGGEFKYQFWNYRGQGAAGSSGDPFDLAFSGMFEYVSFDQTSVTSFGVNVLGSMPFVAKGGRVFGPYGRFNVRMTTLGNSSPNSNTDIKFALSPGFMLQMTNQARAFVELSFDDNTGISFGVQFGSF